MRQAPANQATRKNLGAMARGLCAALFCALLTAAPHKGFAQEEAAQLPTGRAYAVAEADTSGLAVNSETLPAATAAPYIAMLYHRLSGQVPDFSAWAEETDEFKAANTFDKDLVRSEKAAEALRAYNLITPAEQIVIEAPVRLSSYSRARHGFLVQNISADTFYSFSFMQKNYAVVPLNIMDFQWLAVDSTSQRDAMAERLETDGNQAVMYLYLAPLAADTAQPLQLDGDTFWLLSARIQRVQIFDARRARLLWEGFGHAEVQRSRQEVLDLYK